MNPPVWADKFLEWYCNPLLLEDLQGDLYEIYEDNYLRKGKRAADLLYVWLVIRSFRLSVIKRPVHSKSINMTTNHLKIAWRIMKRNKLHASLNILGLVLGISCFILLGFFVSRELTFDRYHPRSGDIYRVWLKEDYGDGKIFFNTVTPLIFKDFLQDNIDGIEEVAQWNITNFQVNHEAQRFNEQVAILSPEFLNIFAIDLAYSAGPQPLSSPEGLLISRDHALKYFGEEEAIGKTLTIVINDQAREFEVSGILDDFPENTGFRFDMAISSLNDELIYGPDQLDAWFSVSPETYVRLEEGISPEAIASQVQSAVERVLGDRVRPGEYNIGFQPLVDIHLGDDFPAGLIPIGNKSEVWVLAGIALLVLTIACLNFITMTLAQSTNRYREVGIRKVMGALRKSLVRQHFTESMLTVAISGFLAAGLTVLAIPWFNRLTGAGIVPGFSWWYIPAFLLLVVFLGALAGFYPGLILARWQASNILRGQVKTGKNHLFRRGIVIFQFMITAFLITATVVMNRQMNYLQSTDLGMDYSATVAAVIPPVQGAGNLSELVTSTMEKALPVIDRLEAVPGVHNIGLGSHTFGRNGWTSIGFTDDTDQFRKTNLLATDPAFFNTFSLTIKQGRAFNPENPADKTQGVILNETAARYFFNQEDPVGRRLPSRRFLDHQVIGVVKDFHFTSLHNEIAPLIIVQDPGIIGPGVSDIMFDDFPTPKVVFKFDRRPLSAVVDQLENIWEDVFPDEELSYRFIESDMASLYTRERRIQGMMLAATVLSIFIACLGLLGLTILMLNGRVKEIGIRKVIGASPSRIFSTLTGKIVIQMGTGFILSVPLAWLLMGEWLNRFAYHISLSPWYFVISGILAIGLAVVVISYHTIRAVSNNPVNALRSE